MRQRLVLRQVAVGVDRHCGHLRQPRQHVRRQRRATEWLQAFVDAAHARAATARQYQSGDLALQRQN
jgi:hypothetical protein